MPIVAVIADIQTKQCPSCKERKSIVEFCRDKRRPDGHYCYCKACVFLKAKSYYDANPEKRAQKAEKARNKYKQNPLPKREQNRSWSAKNKERVKEIQKRWKKDKPEMAAAIWKRSNKKVRSTINGKLSDSIRRRINKTLKNGWKGGHWEDLVGYTVESLKLHLEKQFRPGMTWDNYGKWHIDHKVPISNFHYQSYQDKEFIKCWRLSNLQPLWALENMRKGNREVI
jgi:hypothetical protein